MTGTPEHKAWKAMNARCYKVNGKQYADYGGRGIKVCDRWREANGQGFVNFLADMGPKPSPKHSIDRIDVNGNYEPTNCRWATLKKQANNKRDNKYLTYKGETKTMQEWSDALNVCYFLVRSRIRLGWTVEDAFEVPVGGKPPNAKKYEFQGQLLSVPEIAKITGVPEPTIRCRLSKGLTAEDAVDPKRKGIRSNNRLVTAFGETLTITQWAEKTGINQNTLRSRIIYRGMDPEKALTMQKSSRQN